MLKQFVTANVPGDNESKERWVVDNAKGFSTQGTERKHKDIKYKLIDIPNFPPLPYLIIKNLIKNFKIKNCVLEI